MLMLHCLLYLQFSLVLKSDLVWTPIPQFIDHFSSISEQQFATYSDLSFQAFLYPVTNSTINPRPANETTWLLDGTVSQSLPEVKICCIFFFAPVRSHCPSLLPREVNRRCEAQSPFH